MPLKLKKSSESGANRRMPLLPDDEYLPGKIVDIEVVDVDTKFGPKKKARFVIELNKFKDPYSEGGEEPRRVSVKCNLPEKGRGVHEKSNLYKFVCVVMGKDPWEDNEDFDVETLSRKKMAVRVMMTTSEAQEQTILNDENEEETVDDYQYQYVTSYRGPKSKAEIKDDEEEAEDEADEEAEEKPAKKGKVKPAKSKVKDDEEDEDEDEDEDADEEDEEEEEVKPKKGKVKDAKGIKPKNKAKAEEEEEEDEDEEAEDEEGEDLSLSPKILKPLVAGLTKKAKNEAGKIKVKDVMKKLGIKAMSDLKTVSEDKARRIGKLLGIELPEDDEDDDEKLNFLNG